VAPSRAGFEILGAEKFKISARRTAPAQANSLRFGTLFSSPSPGQ